MILNSLRPLTPVPKVCPQIHHPATNLPEPYLIASNPLKVRELWKLWKAKRGLPWISERATRLHCRCSCLLNNNSSPTSKTLPARGVGSGLRTLNSSRPQTTTPTVFHMPGTQSFKALGISNVVDHGGEEDSS